MPRYEKVGPKGAEYIDLHIDGARVRTETGKVGGKSKIKEVTHKSDYAAGSRFTRAIAAAKEKGFAHVSTLRQTASNAEMEAAIAKTPDDVALRLAYGEWLEAQGDPRGELFAIQRTIAETKAEPMPLRKHEHAVLSAHSSLLYGTLDELLHVEEQRPVVRVEWKLGFFDEVELRLSEGGMPWFPKLSEAVHVLAGHPSSRLIQRLVLGGSASDYRPALKEVLGVSKTLRSLRVTGQLWGEYTPGEHRVGDLAPLCKAHPQLEELDMKVGKEPLDGLAHPNLVTLDLWTNQLGPRAIQSLARARWPRLGTFGIAIGTAASVKPADFATLLDAKTLPAIKKLKLGVVPDVAFANALLAHAAKLKLDALVLVNTDADVVDSIRSSTSVPVSTEERET